MTQSNILIIEDDWFTAEDTKGKLENLGYLVPDIVSSGEEAVKKAEECRPNLVLMDIVLKGAMDGIEAAEQIKAKFNIPIVYVTAHADKELMERAKITEPFGYITKPYETAELHTAIEIALYKHKMEARLRQAQKMEAIGTMAGGVAHEFNNLLSPIMVNTEMVMTDLPSQSPLQQNLKQIFQAGERARDLVTQILTFSRQKPQERANIRIGILFQEIINLLRSSLPSTIEIRQNFTAAIDTVHANPSQMNQVLMNLCINAAHAMREKGGKLEISLTDEHLDSDAGGQFPDLKPGSYLKLTVSDTGHGIDDSIVQHIFEPYFTTKEPDEGIGMGLAIAHGIVKNHGGDIAVESVLGKGTTFHVMFPKIEAEIPATAEPAVRLPRGSERILFVDDEKVAVNAVKPMLERLHYKVEARTSSVEILEVFRNKPDAFDLVITDMTMPNMTGVELAKKIMKIRPDIPIILCTGYSEQIDEKRAKEMGIRAYVVKPIIMSEMANTIRGVLDKK